MAKSPPRLLLLAPPLLLLLLLAGAARAQGGGGGSGGFVADAQTPADDSFASGGSGADASSSPFDDPSTNNTLAPGSEGARLRYTAVGTSAYDADVGLPIPLFKALTGREPSPNPTVRGARGGGGVCGCVLKRRAGN